MSTPKLEEKTTRRGFLRDTAVTALVAGVATACSKPVDQASATQQAQPTGGTMGPHDTASAADAMDAMHEKGIKAFPAKTAGKRAQPFAPTMDGGGKVSGHNA